MFFLGKKVLVTGGTGFIGSHFIDRLLKKGAVVRGGAHRRSCGLFTDGVEWVKADLSCYEDCLRAAEGIDYVIHCAGGVGAASVVKKTDILAGIGLNLILTVQMLRAAIEKEVKRFLLFSSSTGYPAYGHPVKEEEMWAGPVHPGYMGYGTMRRYLESLAEFCCQSSAMKIAIIRPTAVYGPGDNFNPLTCHVIPALIGKIMENKDSMEVWGSGEEIRDFLYIDDLVNGCLLALEKYARCQPVNIGYGSGYSIKEVVRLLLEIAGRSGVKVEYNALKPTNIPVRLVDIAKAEKILGFKPGISLEEGLERTLEWYLANKDRI
ncbi:GDP-fucose synthetase [Desulfocucumis palustris]|uniref:GDP-fucose synthetase n=1 Tax=Desulfocucumis palustris TaxID=1898651 RepID=A0A2L2XAW9_9FIRM|nr:GDP-fucose synthetase [Desulfocucumis palustris]